MSDTGRRQQWIDPVVVGSGRQFLGPGGNRVGARYADYRRALLAGSITRGGGPLESGFRSIRDGDVLWLYAGPEVLGALVRTLRARISRSA
jgi:hypothetical protein